MSVPEHYFRYETNVDETFHLWACIAADKSFAVHVWARKRPETDVGWKPWFGGVEQHVSPVICGRPVDRSDCAILGGKCCHDGSSEAFDRTYDRVEEAIKSGNVSLMFPRVAYIFDQRWNMMTEGK